MKFTCRSLVEECCYTICSQHGPVPLGTAETAEGDNYYQSGSKLIVLLLTIPLQMQYLKSLSIYIWPHLSAMQPKPQPLKGSSIQKPTVNRNKMNCIWELKEIIGIAITEEN